MHIGLITPGFSANEEDWCIPVLLHLIRRLSRNYTVTIIALRYPPRVGQYTVAGATVYPIGGADRTGLQRGLLLSKALKQLLQIGRAQRFDLLHAFWADEPGFLAVSAGRLLGVPTLVSIMGGELVAFPELNYGGRLSRLNRLLSSIALRHATNVSVGSAYLAQLAQPFMPGRTLKRLTLGVEADLFTPTGPQIDLGPGAHLLAVGSLVPIKHQELLIHTLAKIPDPAVQLHLIGSGPEHIALAGLAQELGVAQRVRLHGAIAHEELPAYYRAADLCLLGSYYESQCLALVEAAACGRVTIGSAVGLMPELGIPTAAGDSTALASNITALLAKPAERQALGLQCHALVEQHYRMEQTVQVLARLYSDTVEQGNKDAAR